MAFAIGAADRRAEAVRLLLDDDRDRDRGLSAGRRDEPRVVDAAEPELGRAGLAGDVEARGEDPAAVPPCTTSRIIWFSWAAVSGLMARASVCGLVFVTVEP